MNVVAKGFGIPTNNILGYTLKLFTDVDLYAAEKPTWAEQSMDHSPEQSDNDQSFIDVTNDLTQVRLWRNRQEVAKNIHVYLPLMLEWMKQKNLSYIDIEICALKINRHDELETEVVKSLVIEPVGDQPF